jgi:hypothetical protein
MPISKAGKKIKSNLEKQYGKKKGEQVFYAMENKGEIPGMKKMKGYARGGMNDLQRRVQKEQEDRMSSDRKMARDQRKAQREMERKARREQLKNRLTRTGRDKTGMPVVGGGNPTSTSRRPILKRKPMSAASRGFSKGGLTKSTGTLNTGIKKAGE